MSQQYFELALRPPHGVAFVQWADGSIHIRYASANVVILRESLLGLARQLSEQAIKQLEAERQAEIDRQRMPMSRLETINTEIESLKQAATVEPSGTTSPPVVNAPGVVIGKVTADPLGV